LTVVSGGVVFSTIQLFHSDDGGKHPALTERGNVIVIADEAHRSQYGLQARVDKETGELSYGFARNLRDALPNAVFIGFTDTPIETHDKVTTNVFGEVIDPPYDIHASGRGQGHGADLLREPFCQAEIERDHQGRVGRKLQ
jgi:type I restriction enzyme R subunit